MAASSSSAGRSSRLFLLAVVACFLSSLVTKSYGHGFLLNPLSRARAIGKAEWEAAGGSGLGKAPFRTYSAAAGGGTINDQPDVCGDPHQDVGDMNLRNSITAIQATYTAGQTISVSYSMRVNHGGWLAVKICPSARLNPSQSCFDQFTLTNADTGFTRWWITYGAFGYGIPPETYTTRWRLPAGVTCDGGCVLQMNYRTANSCVDKCSAAECGPVYSARRVPVTGVSAGVLDQCGTYGNPSTAPRGEVFRDCADIRITGGGSTSSSSPPPPPQSSNPVRSPPPTGGSTNCIQTPNAASFCTGKKAGMYGDKCTQCAKYYWCYGGGASYMSCAPGTFMNSGGGTSCDYLNRITC